MPPQPLTPEVSAMEAHLEALFGGSQAGLIEIAWTEPDAKDGRLKVSRARLFDVDDLDSAAECARQANEDHCANVYVGAALRSEDSDRKRRGGMHAMLSAPAFWADFDGQGEADHARKTAFDLKIPPHLIITTGRSPHLRQQFWWLLEEPVTDGDHLKASLKQLNQLLGGDGSVCEPGRVMRLGGSLAYPAKPGRVLEKTEFEVHATRSPYAEGEIQKVLAAAIEEAQPAGLTVLDGGAETIGRDPVDGRLSTDALIEEAMSGMGSPSGWRPRVLRLVANWVSSGWRDDQILAVAPALTRSDLGYSLGETRGEIAQMIYGARHKWGVADPAQETPEVPDALFDNQQVWRKRPMPDQIIEGVLIDQSLGLLFGDRGSGKSFLAVDMACCLAAGKDWHGHKVQQRRGAILSGEGSIDLTARIAVWEDYHNATPDIVHSAVSYKIKDPAIRARIIDEMGEFGAQFLVVDTVRRAMSGDENNQDDVGAFIDACLEISAALKATILLVHHKASGALKARGSTIWEADSDLVMFCEATEQIPLSFSLSTQKQKMLAPAERMEFTTRSHSVGQWASLVIEPSKATRSAPNLGGEEHSRGRPPNTRAAIIDALRIKSPQSSGELSERLNKSASHIRGLMGDMQRRGQVVAVAGGWGLP